MVRNHILYRCVQCEKDENSERKICIYLDQFAVSDMVELEMESIWEEIRKVVIDLKENDKIFCPLSPEHYIKTSQKDIKKARIHDEFLYNLSNGFSFKPELFLTSQLISSKIRNNNIPLQTYLYENINNVSR